MSKQISSKRSHQAVHAVAPEATVADQGSGADLSVFKAGVGTVRDLAVSLGIGPAENAESRVAIAVEGAVPDTFVSVATEVGAEYEPLVGAHFHADKVAEARAYLLGIDPMRGVVAALLRQIDDEILRKKAVVAQESRALYKYLQAIAGTTRGKPIREPLDRMTASMRKPRKAKAPAETPIPAAPQPAPVDAAK